MASVINNSEGFGGIGPEEIISKNGICDF